MEIEQAAIGFCAVGSEPRLAVLLSLVRAGPEGLSIGEIQARVGQPPSTLAHHLRALTAASLVVQEKRGRSVINRAAYDHIETLARYLLRECCRDAAASHPAHAGHQQLVTSVSRAGTHEVRS